MKILALLLLLAVPGQTQQLPVVADYIDFSGGLNNETASVYLKNNESPDLLNVVIDEPLGSISQRNGWEVCGHIPSGNDITNLYAYTKINGARNLIVTDNETVWQTSDCQAFTQIVTGWDVNSTPRFATIKDKLWITNGVDSVVAWDGTTASVLDGTSETPNVPKGKYIAWWKNRVWMGNTTVEPSGAFFSSIYNPAGAALDPAVSSEAWTNTNNQVYFNRGDGSPLYGLKVYRDALYGIKETGLSRLVFQDEYVLNVVKNVTTIGSKFNESFVEMDDGLLRYAGRDGTYKFDGSIVKRTSSKWTPTYESFQQPSAVVANYRAWNTAAQWLTGTAVNYATPSDKPTSISMINEYLTGPNIGAESNDSSHFDTTENFISTDTHSYWGSRSWMTSLRNYDDSWSGITVSVYDSDDNLLTTAGCPGDVGEWRMCNVSWSSSTFTSSQYVTFSYRHYTNLGVYTDKTIRYDNVIPSRYTFGGAYYGKIALRVKLIGPIGANPHYTCFDIDETTTQTASYESVPFKAVGLSQWGTMDVVQGVNYSTVTYSIRLATSAYNLSLATYETITPGTVVSTGTEPWIQWKAETETSTRNSVPYIASVRFNWWTGFPIKSLLSGINYNGRYWLSACATPGLLYNDIVVVESKSPIESHTLYDIPLSAMTLWNDNLYGAIANSSAIARVDYGSTDGGAAITSYWNSRDEVYSAPLYYKSINKAIVDYSAIPANASLDIGLSDDFGATYSQKTVDVGISINPRNTKNINFDANRALQFRTRVFNDTLGVGWKIYGLHTYGTANQFMGQ